MNTSHVLESLNMTKGESLTLEKAADRMEFEALPLLASRLDCNGVNTGCECNHSHTSCGCNGNNSSCSCNSLAIDCPSKNIG
jgi:hypothetical protein